MALPAGFAGILLLFVLLFLASTWLSARMMRRDARLARERGQAPPDFLGWWPRVVAAQAWLLAGAALLFALGIAAFAAGNDSVGRGATLLGVGAACYLLHAKVLVAVARRA